MGDILKRINNTVCIVITWIYAPFVTCMWVWCKLHKCKCQIELCLYHCLLGLTTREGCTWLLTCYPIIRGSRTWRTLGQKTVNKQIRTTYICHKQDTHFKMKTMLSPWFCRQLGHTCWSFHSAYPASCVVLLCLHQSNQVACLKKA